MQTIISLYFFTSSEVDAGYESYLEDTDKKALIKYHFNFLKNKLGIILSRSLLIPYISFPQKIAYKNDSFKSVLLKEMMEWTPDQEVSIIGEGMGWKRECYTLMSHDHNMQFFRGKRSLNSLINSDLQSICKILLLWKCFQLFGNFHCPWRPHELGNKKRHQGWRDILTFNFRVLHSHFV